MRATDKVYRAFYELRRETAYYTEIKERTGLSHSSLQNALERMVAKGLLTREKTKALTFYTLTDKKRAALKFSECAMNDFNKLSPNITNPLRNFLRNTPKETYTIVLFGSVVRKEERAESDIDLLIVTNGTKDFRAAKQAAELTTEYPLSLFYATIEQFLSNEDDLIKQARKTGIPIYHEQNYYEATHDEYRQTIHGQETPRERTGSQYTARTKNKR